MRTGSGRRLGREGRRAALLRMAREYAEAGEVHAADLSAPDLDATLRGLEGELRAVLGAREDAMDPLKAFHRELHDFATRMAGEARGPDGSRHAMESRLFLVPVCGTAAEIGGYFGDLGTAAAFARSFKEHGVAARHGATVSVAERLIGTLAVSTATHGAIVELHRAMLADVSAFQGEGREAGIADAVLRERFGGMRPCDVERRAGAAATTLHVVAIRRMTAAAGRTMPHDHLTEIARASGGDAGALWAAAMTRDAMMVDPPQSFPGAAIAAAVNAIVTEIAEAASEEDRDEPAVARSIHVSTGDRDLTVAFDYDERRRAPITIPSHVLEWDPARIGGCIDNQRGPETTLLEYRDVAALAARRGGTARGVGEWLAARAAWPPSSLGLQ